MNSTNPKIQALNFLIECLDEFQPETRYGLDENYGASVLDSINYFEEIEDVLYYFQNPHKFINEINVGVFSLLVEDRIMNLDYSKNKKMLTEIENIIIDMQVETPYAINESLFNGMLYDFY